MSRTKYEVRLLRTAEDDLTDIIVYIAADRLTAAIKLSNRFNQKLSLLADNPQIGSKPKEDSLVKLGYRYLILDNYLIFYVIEERVIYIHRIIHGARDYTQLL
jgi:plasmid stabilization system protein ParE